jgi:hypothetical protein
MEAFDAHRRRLGESGLSEALDRLRSRIERSDSGDPLLSLAEVLAWLFALRELHDAKLTAPAKLHQSTEDEQTFAGLIFARHQVAHRLEGVAGLIFSPSSPIRAGGPRIVHLSSDLRWMPRDRLNASRPHPHLAPFYDQHVAGKPVLQPIDVGAAFILGLQ